MGDDDLLVSEELAKLDAESAAAEAAVERLVSEELARSELVVETPAVQQERRRAGALPSEVRQALTALDGRLIAVLKNRDIRLVRTQWLLDQPPGFRMPHRQELEAIEASTSGSSPLLSADESVGLVHRGDRSLGALTYPWLSAGDPDPEGRRVEVIRKALAQLRHIEAFFWE